MNDTIPPPGSLGQVHVIPPGLLLLIDSQDRQRLVDRLRQNGLAALAALVKDSSVVVDGDTVTITALYQFHAARLCEKRNELIPSVEQEFGTARIVVYCFKEWGSFQFRKNPEPEPRPRPSPASAPHSPRKSLRDIPYSEYLRTDHWNRTRIAALKRADFRCQVCNAGDTTLDVHHRTYERRGEEDDADLIVLCRTCHDVFHRAGRLAQ